MDTNTLLTLSREALLLMVLASAPPLLSAMLVGFVMALFQATTQLQESTLAVVPKLCAAVLSLVVAGPWLGAQLSRFVTQLLLLLPDV